VLSLSIAASIFVGCSLIHHALASRAAAGRSWAAEKLLRALLPSARPPRAALESLWKIVAFVLLTYAPMWFLFGIVWLYSGDLEIPAPGTFLSRQKPSSRGIVGLVLGVELLVLGLLSLWPALRASVQSRLASMGEGVAAAAGVAAIIGTDQTDALLELAKATFRSVAADRLDRRLLDTNRPAAEVFVVSKPVLLGEIDVRARACAGGGRRGRAARARGRRGAHASMRAPSDDDPARAQVFLSHS
jgi:hypothetical protein